MTGDTGLPGIQGDKGSNGMRVSSDAYILKSRKFFFNFCW